MMSPCATRSALSPNVVRNSPAGIVRRTNRTNRTHSKIAKNASNSGIIRKLVHLGSSPDKEICKPIFDPIIANPIISSPTDSAREVFDPGSARTKAQAMPKDTSAARYKLLSNTVLRQLGNGSLSH